MLRGLRVSLATALSLFPVVLQAGAQDIVNVYTWSQEIPPAVIAEFEKETGIRVNHSSYDSNEVMYAKLRANSAGFDLIEPSSYYVQRMQHLGLLERLDYARLREARHLDPWFSKQAYDPGNHYSVPFIWGITGIFANRHYFSPDSITRWSDLSDPTFINQLMLLDDPREAFSMALLMLGYSINDTNPAHIHEAWLKLRALMPNVRLFNTDAVKSILIDEDATIGMAWNGDLANAKQENNQLAFIIPQGKFEIWIDSFAILKTAPHRDNAYKFLNFLLRPDIARQISLRIGYATTNLAARESMPDAVKHNPSLYPSAERLREGEVQTDVGDNTFALYEKYWEKLKTGV